MTTEIEGIKTNEFLRRRKLRLQQVREQSKDIAKKIRQRAKVEKSRQVGELDASREREYLRHQEKLVKRLELLYARGVKSVGASHKIASEVRQASPEKTDLSKQRGREAAAELKRKRQEQLDKQKELLDRKLQAREAANEISREKTSTVANKQSTRTFISDKTNDKGIPDEVPTKEVNNNINENVKLNDMATQWEFEPVPNEWEAEVPALSLPREDRDTPKEYINHNNNAESKSDKSKRLDLFALSDEMPSSLRGGLIDIPDARIPVKPSLTLVSEYLQNRGLRLRDTDIPATSKKSSSDLQSLKQTILKTRASKTDGSIFNTVCHVLDEEVVPVPSWHAERNCEVCSHNVSYHGPKKGRQINVTNSQINQIFRLNHPPDQESAPSPVLRGSSLFCKNKVAQRNGRPTVSGKEKSTGKSSVSSTMPSASIKKNSITMYNHATRDTRAISCGDDRFVVTNLQTDEDAYSQAAKEASSIDATDKEHQNRLQEMRHKIAMTKKSVEKEYNDTISFLNSLPKGNKPIKTAYMDDRRQQMLKYSRQQKLQQEFRKIERECKKHHNSKSKGKSLESNLQQFVSPSKDHSSFEARDHQYSWMPVPEADENLAIHAIPTSTKERKCGNTVKFSKVDSYHEYRSRHKHTPPTKDTDGKPSKRVTETVIIQNGSETSDSVSVSSDTSSVEEMGLEKRVSKENPLQLSKELTDSDRIIIYKILNSKRKEKSKKKKAKLLNDIATSLCSLKERDVNSKKVENSYNATDKESSKANNKYNNNKLSIEHLEEGIYKTTKEKGDNIASIYFGDQNRILTEDENHHGRACTCGKQLIKEQHQEMGANIENGDTGQPTPTSPSGGVNCKCGHTGSLQTTKRFDTVQASAATSTSSFKTAAAPTYDEKSDGAEGILPGGGYVKLLDDDGQEAGKFFIGASGFLKDNAYEVIIQLRKKDSTKSDCTKLDAKPSEQVNNLQEVIGEQSKEPPVSSSEDTHKNRLEKLPEDNTSEIICKDLPRDPEVANKVVIDDLLDNKRNEPTTIRHNNATEELNIDTNENQSDKYSDKGVCTSFHLSYNIPSHIPKSDPICVKSAASVYTQTTDGTPHSRPMFFHMSSSTSTAYMSPPEMVLPKFFRHDSEDVYDNSQIINVQCGKFNSKGSEEHEHCICQYCIKAKSHERCKSNRSSKTKLHTPPNSARSLITNYTEDADNEHGHKKHKCRKCIQPGRKCSNTHNKKNVSGREEPRTLSSTAKSRTINSQIHTKVGKHNLNPTVKKYVNKLLSLSKEGIKAKDVANQECSAVTTPGSSIIDVPWNNVRQNTLVEHKISLEQLKSALMQQIHQEYIKQFRYERNVNYNIKQSKMSQSRIPKRKPLHKIKCLNISKSLLVRNKQLKQNIESQKASKTEMPSTVRAESTETATPFPSINKIRSRSTPTPRQIESDENDFKNKVSDMVNNHVLNDGNAGIKRHSPENKQNSHGIFLITAHKAIATADDKNVTDHKDYKEDTKDIFLQYQDVPKNTSTQTCKDNEDTELNYMKLAENKLQNMEKIADLTEKCTKRLSNLAKVLEEVRRNKSMAYSQISTSDSASDSDRRSDKQANSQAIQSSDLVFEISKKESKLSTSILVSECDRTETSDTTNYVTILTDIPKPAESKLPMDTIADTSHDDYSSSDDQNKVRNKTRPPPALSRLHLKHGNQGYITPHELSTVLEVDSPLSLKVKNQSSRNDNKGDVSNASERDSDTNEQVLKDTLEKIRKSNEERVKDPDILQSNPNNNVSKSYTKKTATDSSDYSKLQMMDLKQFNNIMLQPFISIHEYAKQCNVGTLDEGSNLDDIPKDDPIIDDLSSMQSDSSLPDVIAELLKRKIISEPFKFDTASNMNSTTGSSESTLSVLALSKVRTNKKKASVVFQNKENVAETSDTLSFSSNPDLENAFKKLGMGWASSTLKKTKERLALSSSSNTSSSSLSQFKLKSFNKQEIPALVTDSVSSILNSSKKPLDGRRPMDNSKNSGQQTSLTKSMTVKEFLTNELADKITFTNKSKRNDTEEEFVSLFETKMPEEMKHSSQMIREERSVDSAAGGPRARTSTPVQIFKSMTYHSSSSSNVSNGLFSNADDLSSVKVTSNSIRNHSTSDKDDLTIPNCSLRTKKIGSDASKSD